jgi:hypothetical protein
MHIVHGVMHGVCGAQRMRHNHSHQVPQMIAPRGGPLPHTQQEEAGEVVHTQLV